MRGVELAMDQFGLALWSLTPGTPAAARAPPRLRRPVAAPVEATGESGGDVFGGQRWMWPAAAAVGVAETEAARADTTTTFKTFISHRSGHTTPTRLNPPAVVSLRLQPQP